MHDTIPCDLMYPPVTSVALIRQPLVSTEQYTVELKLNIALAIASDHAIYPR